MRNYFFPLIFILFISCEKEESCDTIPKFVTLEVSEVSYSKFTISGEIKINECDNTLIQKGLVYSKSELPTISNSKLIFNDGVFSKTIENLEKSTTYYIRPFVTNQEGDFYGPQITVSTLQTNITFSNIVSQALISSVQVTSDFEFSAGSGFEISKKGVSINGSKYYDEENSGNKIDVTIENLQENTDYSFIVFVESSYGNYQSSSNDFKTENSSSTVEDTTVDNISYDSATFTSSYSNQYTGNDITTEKGFWVSKSQDFNDYVKLNSELDSEGIVYNYNNLETDTTYYVKAFVTNEFGTSFGSISEFKTIYAGYTFGSFGASNISYTSADFYTQEFVESSGPDIISKGFMYSKVENFSDQNSTVILDSTSGQNVISITAENLELNTTYFLKIIITNAYGTFTSESISFTTENVDYDFGTINISEIGFETVKIGSEFELTSTQLETLEKGIQISTNSSFDDATWINDNSNGNSIYLDNISNLNFNTQYFVRVFVENKYGAFYSGSESFITFNTGYVFTSTQSSLVEYSTATVSTNFTHVINTEPEIIDKGFYLSENELSLVSSQTRVVQSGQELGYEFEFLKHNTKYYYKAFVKNKYGEFTSDTFTFITKNATPTFSFNLQTENVGFDNITPLISIETKDDTNINTLEFEILKGGVTEQNFDYLNTYDSSFNGGDINQELSQLEPNTSYSIKFRLVNEYGTFNSDSYSFKTKDDTPFMKFANISSAYNPDRFSITYNINIVDGDVPKNIYVKYKNIEEDTYHRVDFDLETNDTDTWWIDNISRRIESNIVPGPQYDFVLYYENEWNTFTTTISGTLAFPYEVGDEALGGVIVYIDESGYHGLVAAKYESIRKLKWSTDNSIVTDLNLGDDGKANTRIIVDYYNGIGESAPAAEYCDNYVSEGFDDWFLPSIDDFYIGQKAIHKAMADKYNSFYANHDYLWSSNEDSALETHSIGVYNNGCSANNCRTRQNKETEVSTLPIRRF
ncbi:MAG: hypothetical protein P8H91_08190 [Flavobacteriaceae bacterium]|nr:hypothetical protein [Flavobacteriaceae bacterium]